MTTTTQDVLTAADNRAGAAASTVKSHHAAIVESLRQAIGPEDYALAKTRLSVIDEAIKADYRPFLQQVSAIAQKAGVAFPAVLNGWLSKLNEVCDIAPRQLREGIAAYDALTYDSVKCMHRDDVDINKRVEVIAVIRRLLRSHDGMLSFMESQKAQAEFYIKDSGWPQSMAGAASMTAASGPLDTAPRVQKVESEFSVG